MSAIEQTFQTEDQIPIAANLYLNSKQSPASKRLIIVAPGFSQYKDSVSLRALGDTLCTLADILVVDFRGTGKSGGRYFFGAKEYQDLHPILSWGRAHYERITLLGFSLGAYTAVRCGYSYPNLLDQLCLVACPTQFEAIVKSGLFISHYIKLLTNPPVLQIPAQNSIRFRWGWPFSEKPNASALAKHIQLPAAFLQSEHDSLVAPHLTQSVYESYAGTKTITTVPGSLHAEALFLKNPKEFMAWLTCYLQK